MELPELLSFAKVMELHPVYSSPLTPPSPPQRGERRKVRGAIGMHPGVPLCEAQ